MKTRTTGFRRAMIMNFKEIFAAVAAVSGIFVASCTKEADSLSSATVKVFTATIEESNCKTTLTEAGKVFWEEGDRIAINGNSVAPAFEYEATPVAGSPSIATFTSVDPSRTPSAPYVAMYPASLFNGSNNGVYLLPSAQKYEAGKFVAPMYAESETAYLSFKNICGVFCFSLKGDCIVKSISVDTNAGGENICGGFNINSKLEIEFNNGHQNVTLDCADGVQLNKETPVSFYIYLPPQTYTAGMKISVNKADGSTFEKVTQKDVTVERNTIYGFNWTLPSPRPGTKGTTAAETSAGKIDVPWVQLWENGPKWAEYNYGVTDGSITGCGSYIGCRMTKGWGSNWRRPSKEEIQALVNNCDHSWDEDKKGVWFTGRDDYAANRVFFPAAGFEVATGKEIKDAGKVGHYLSSDNHQEQSYIKAFMLNFEHKDDGTTSVRAADYTAELGAVVNEFTVRFVVN